MDSSVDGESGLGWLIVGHVCKPHGIQGDVLVDIDTDFPDRVFPGVRIGLGDDSGPQEFFHVHRVRNHKGSWLMSLKDIRQRELVEQWRGRFVYLPEQSLDELPEGYYYEHHLIGLECISPAGEALGVVVGLDTGPGQVRLVVRKEGREHLVPYVPEIVHSVDLEANQVVIDAPLGLFDEDSVPDP